MRHAAGARGRLYSGLLVVCAAVALSSCREADAPKDGVAELRYWRTLPGAAGEAQDELAESFNASQDEIHVTAEFQGSYGELATKLMTAAVAGRGPHVTQLGTFEIRQFARAGVLVDLKPYRDGPQGIDTSDWPATVAEGGRVGDGVYWLPFNVTVPVLYYNAEAFEAAGLGAPSTWDEFFAYAQQLTQRDASGRVTRAGLAVWNLTWPWLSAIWSEGGELARDDGTVITLDHPVAIELFTKLKALIASGAAIVPDAASGGHRTAFINGHAAMILDSPAPYDQITRGAAGFTPRIALYPAGRAGRVYAPGGGGLAMLATTPPEVRDAAWEFIRFMLASEQLGRYAAQSGYVAFTMGAQAAAEAQERRIGGEDWQAIHEALQYVRADFDVTGSPAIRNAFERAFQRIVFERADVATVLREADAKAEREIVHER